MPIGVLSSYIEFIKNSVILGHFDTIHRRFGRSLHFGTGIAR